MRSVEPTRDDGSKITLTTGVTTTLYDGQDVSESNDGVVVVRENGRESYLRKRASKSSRFPRAASFLRYSSVSIADIFSAAAVLIN